MKRLVLSPAARSDLKNIGEYIASENKPAATRIVREIKARFKTLLKFPEVGRRRNDLKKGLRSFPAGKYLVFLPRNRRPSSDCPRPPRLARH